MANYLVTGGAGFIGANLAKKLISVGHKVRVLDNFRAGKFAKRFFDEVEYMEGDIRSIEDLKKAMQGVDGVFHFAAVPRMSYSIAHPLETHEVNALGTLKLLEVARELGVKRVVFSSSSSIYGGCEVGASLREDMKPNPMSPYGLQKFIGEEYSRLYSQLHELETVALRYFNVYGPLMDADDGPYTLVISKFLKQKADGKPMTVCGDGEYYRDYTHVDDVAQANILAMESDQIRGGEVLNIGYGEPHSVNELVKLIGGEFEFVDPRPGDPKWTKADTSRAREVLGWEPSIALEDGWETCKDVVGKRL